MKVWIDLSNSPHPLLFGSLARVLAEEGGHTVDVTARHNAQTVELARERWPDVVVIGEESPQGRGAKVAALARRVAELRRWARSRRPDVALSHNSYAQIVAGRSLGLPVLTAMDFEHQPANHLAFRLATTVLVPDVLPRDVIRRQGARKGKIRPYPGLKEELYLGDFEPDPSVLSDIGILDPAREAVVVVRTPPSRAVYHRFDNTLFAEVLRAVDSQEHVCMVVLTRHAEQRRMIANMGLTNCLVPERAVDARSLIWAADLVIGAGGTMTREAALMGVPTFSVYAGAQPAVDRSLESRGRLMRLSRPDQIGTIEKRERAPESLEMLRARSQEIMSVFMDELRSLARQGRAERRPAP